jgi:hypothetical protein
MAVKLKMNNANLDLKTNIGQLIKGEDGGYYIPVIDEEGNLTWVASEEEMPEIVGANITGPAGEPGVYVGTEEPTDEDARIWINPEGQGTAGDSIATKAYVDEAISNIEAPTPDLTGYATETFVEEAINAALDSIAHAEDGAY